MVVRCQRSAIWGVLVVGALLVTPAEGSAAPLDLAPQRIDFSDFAGAGFTADPGAGQLDSNDWRIVGLSSGDLLFGEEQTAGDFARGLSAGGVAVGGIYAFDVDIGEQIDPALGFQPNAGDLTPGVVTLRLRNTTGTTVAAVEVDYELWNLNDAFQATAVTFAASRDDVGYEEFASADFATLEQPSFGAQWDVALRTVTIDDLALADGGFLFLRWTLEDAGNFGARDELALDDVSLRVVEACPNGEIEGSEQCDDGNFDDEDGCSNACIGRIAGETGGTEETDGEATGTFTDGLDGGTTRGEGTESLDAGQDSSVGAGSEGTVGTSDSEGADPAGSETGLATTTTENPGSSGGTDGVGVNGSDANPAQPADTILDDDGCGCRSAPRTPWWAAVLLLGRRRRRLDQPSVRAAE